MNRKSSLFFTLMLVLIGLISGCELNEDKKILEEAKLSFVVSESFLGPYDIGYLMLHDQEGNLLNNRQLINGIEFNVEEGEIPVNSYTVIRISKNIYGPVHTHTVYTIADIDPLKRYYIQRKNEPEADEKLKGIITLDYSKSGGSPFFTHFGYVGLPHRSEILNKNQGTRTLRLFENSNSLTMAIKSESNQWKFKMLNDLEVGKRYEVEHVDSLQLVKNQFEPDVTGLSQVQVILKSLKEGEEYWEPEALYLEDFWSEWSDRKKVFVAYPEELGKNFYTEIKGFPTDWIPYNYYLYVRYGSAINQGPKFKSGFDYEVEGNSPFSFTLQRLSGSAYYEFEWSNTVTVNSDSYTTNWNFFGKGTGIDHFELPEEIKGIAKGWITDKGKITYKVKQASLEKSYDDYLDRFHRNPLERKDWEELYLIRLF